MSSDKLKIAIVGAGIWGENHAAIYQDHPMAEIVAVCDQNLNKARQLAGKIGVDAVFNNHQDLLVHSDCDVLAIVTPDFAHADIAVAAARARRSMIIEKPLATTREDVYRIREAVEKYQVRVMVDLHNRWSPAFNVAHQALEKGELGDIQSAYFRLNDTKWVATDMLAWSARSSILWFLGSHSLDTLRWFFGSEVRRVYAVSRSGLLQSLGVDTVDVYQSTLEFDGGGIAQMENGWITPNGNPNVNDIKFNLLGSRGMIAIDASHHNLIQKITDTGLTVPDILVKHDVFGEIKGFAYESIRSFVDRMIDGKPFRVSLADAANTSLAILAIMQSAATREPVDVIYD